MELGSDTVAQAQTLQVCELCEQDGIKWRCFNCNKYLCNNCKIAHNKIPVTAEHQVVTIGTPFQDIHPNILLDNIPCKTHSKKMACLFCEKCEKLVCLECISSNKHNKHTFVSIESALSEKTEQLKKSKETVEEKISFFKDEFQNMAFSCNYIYEMSIMKIKQTELELKEAIEKQSKALQEEVENDRLVTLNRIEDKASKVLTTLTVKLKELDIALSSNQGSNIFEVSKIVPTCSLGQFSIKYYKDEKIKDPKRIFFWSLQKTKVPTLEPVLTMIKSIATKLPGIQCLNVINKNVAWIANHKFNIKEIDVSDNDVETLVDISDRVFDMAPFSECEVLITCDSGIKLLTTQGDIKLFIDTEPLMARGIHVTKQNDLIVGVKESGNIYTPTEESQRAIIIYGSDRKEKCRFEHTFSGERLFTLPQKISTNKNKDILVIDKTSDDTGRVVCLDKEGGLRWICEKDLELNNMAPEDLVTTLTGNIIVNDYGSNSIHILSENGHVLIRKSLSEIGVLYSRSLDIDNLGRLWIGCDSDDEDEHDLYIIKLKYTNL